jgi:hypothetical protein
MRVVIAVVILAVSFPLNGCSRPQQAAYAKPLRSIKGATRLEGEQTAALAEQLAAAWEKSQVRGRHEPQPDRLVA